jgi:phage tail-like protein
MDPPFAGQFLFTVEGVGEIGAFTEVTGLAVHVDVEEVQEGGQNQFAHKLPGRMRWPNIVMKRGITNSDGLFDWLAMTSGEGFAREGNRLSRTNGEVALVDGAGKRIRSWSFEEAFPVRWSGPSFASSSTALAVEELEIAHHGFRSS